MQSFLHDEEIKRTQCEITMSIEDGLQIQNGVQLSYGHLVLLLLPLSSFSSIAYTEGYAPLTTEPMTRIKTRIKHTVVENQLDHSLGKGAWYSFAV